MSGVLDFNEDVLKKNASGIKSQKATMNKNISTALKNFIKELPEFKGIGNPDKTDATNEEEPWKSIAKDGKKPTINDLTKYVAENYYVDIEDRAQEMQTKIEAARKSCIQVCRASAKELLDKQRKILAENDRIISEEESTLARLRQDIAKAEAAQEQLQVEHDHETDATKKR